MNPIELQEALKKVSISPKEEFEQLVYAIILTKLNKMLENGLEENFYLSEYANTPEALNEYTEDMIASGDIQKLSEALNLMKKEILKLRQEKNVLEDRNKRSLEKWDTWEERARALYRELHGKDAPPQG